MYVRSFLTGLFLSLTILFSGSYLQAESLLSSANRLWQFAGPNEGCGALVTHGPVTLGESLTTSEREESLLRGGDGLVARFGEGGWLSLDSDDELNAILTGPERTFCIRFRSDSTKENYPLVSQHGGHDQLAWNFYFYNDCWGFELGTTGNNELLGVIAPWKETRTPESAATQWHDLIGRVTSAKMELFLDGRCVDENLILGDLRRGVVGLLFGAQYNTSNNVPNTIEAGFSGEMDYVAIWNRALTHDEITQLSGGPARADLRARTDRGNGENLQYWCPPNRYAVADCMPFVQDGVFHFMYLLDMSRHCTKNRFGGHQWIQATSTDLVHWEHQPFVVPIDEQNEGSICTGSMFVHDGTYYAFYANRAVEFVTPDGVTRSPFGLICVSTSRDGIHFTKSDKNPLFYLDGGYGEGTRDPVVFEYPETGKFHMYVTTNWNGLGCLVHLSSDDLFHWTREEPVFTLYDGEPECADVFQWGETWYLIVGHTNGYYRVASSPLGPWEKPNGSDIIMPGIVNVPKTAPWKDNRRIVCAWSREHGFGGHSVFHELVRHEDGTLGEKFVAEMIPATGPALVQEEKATASDYRWDNLPGNLRIQATWTFDPAARDSMVGAKLTVGEGKTLTVEPGRRRIRLGDFTLENVDFSTGTMRLDIIIQGELIDLCANDDRAVIETLPAVPERTILLNQAEPARLKLESLTISPLIQP